MRVFCHTNLDDYKGEKWPDEFCCRPIIGDIVESQSGKILKIVRITHVVSKQTKEPYLKVELWKTT